MFARRRPSVMAAGKSAMTKSTTTKSAGMSAAEMPAAEMAMTVEPTAREGMRTAEPVMETVVMEMMKAKERGKGEGRTPGTVATAIGIRRIVSAIGGAVAIAV